MKDYRTVLITGASGGIGAAYAQALAARELDLVLVARSEAKMRKQARQLSADHKSRVEIIGVDLAKPGAAAKVAEKVAQLGLDIDFLVNNAGFGTTGEFHTLDPVREQQEIQLNAAAVVDLCHAFVPGMVQRKRGGILNVASSAAFQPTPYMAVYGATKAFVLSFSDALRAEVRGAGVHVMALCPGPVSTGFFEATGAPTKVMAAIPKGTMLTAEQVVTESLAAFEAGKGVCIPGLAMKTMRLATRFAPREVVLSMSAAAMKRLK